MARAWMMAMVLFAAPSVQQCMSTGDCVQYNNNKAQCEACSNFCEFIPETSDPTRGECDGISIPARCDPCSKVEAAACKGDCDSWCVWDSDKNECFDLGKRIADAIGGIVIALIIASVICVLCIIGCVVFFCCMGGMAAKSAAGPPQQTVVAVPAHGYQQMPPQGGAYPQQQQPGAYPPPPGLDK